MDFPQVDSWISEQRDGMGRHQYLPPRLAIHPRHETGKAGHQSVVKARLRLLQKQRATLLRECLEQSRQSERSVGESRLRLSRRLGAPVLVVGVQVPIAGQIPVELELLELRNCGSEGFLDPLQA